MSVEDSDEQPFSSDEEEVEESSETQLLALSVLASQNTAYGFITQRESVTMEDGKIGKMAVSFDLHSRHQASTPTCSTPQAKRQRGERERERERERRERRD